MLNRLLFSNIPFDCTADFLKEWIEERGFSVAQVTLIRDAVSGTSPSFAHVHFADVTRLDQAELALDGQPLGGRMIQVSRVVWSRTGHR